MKFLIGITLLMLSMTPACAGNTQGTEPLSTRVAELEAQVRDLEHQLTRTKLPRSALLGEWAGNGNVDKRTESFVVHSSPWAISWSLTGGIFGGVLTVTIYDLDSTEPVGEPVNTALEGEDTTFVYETGTFYLHIDGLGKWTVSVEAAQ